MTVEARQCTPDDLIPGASPGDWIVTEANGTTSIYEDRTFRSTFTSVEDISTAAEELYRCYLAGYVHGQHADIVGGADANPLHKLAAQALGIFDISKPSGEPLSASEFLDNLRALLDFEDAEDAEEDEDADENDCEVLYEDEDDEDDPN